MKHLSVKVDANGTTDEVEVARALEARQDASGNVIDFTYARRLSPANGFQAGGTSNGLGANSIAIGSGASTGSVASDSIAIGSTAACTTMDTVAIGNAAKSNAAGSISVGKSAIASKINSIAIGASSAANGSSSITIGDGAQISNSNNSGGIAIGTDADVNTATNGIAIGNSASTRGIDASAIGSSASANGIYSVAIGYNSNAQSQYAISIGRNTVSQNSDDIAIGNGASAQGSGTVAIGKSAGVISTAPNGVAIGTSATVGAGATGAVQIGQGNNGTANTLQFRSYQLLDSSGNIPAERLNGVLAPETLVAVNIKNSASQVSASYRGKSYTFTFPNASKMVDVMVYISISGNVVNISFNGLFNELSPNGYISLVYGVPHPIKDARGSYNNNQDTGNNGSVYVGNDLNCGIQVLGNNIVACYAFGGVTYITDDFE